MRSQWVRERHVVRLRVELLYQAGIAAREGSQSTVVAIEELVQTHQRESDALNPVIVRERLTDDLKYTRLGRETCECLDAALLGSRV